VPRAVAANPAFGPFLFCGVFDRGQAPLPQGGHNSRSCQHHHVAVWAERACPQTTNVEILWPPATDPKPRGRCAP